MEHWTVRFDPTAEAELAILPTTERAAILNAVEKLRAIGPSLGYPYSSQVMGLDQDLRELRPRRGRSPWRAFYRYNGDVIVVAAIGPEATKDRRGFERAVGLALGRLARIDDDSDSDNSGPQVGLSELAASEDERSGG